MILNIDILKRIQSGDKKSFDELFMYYYEDLCHYSNSIIHSVDEAEDLVQNFFVDIWVNRQNIKINNSLKSYLYRSVYNMSLNYLKHENVKSTFVDFVKHSNIGSDDVFSAIYDKEHRDELLDRIHNSIDKLPAQCQEIFLLNRFSNKKTYEIAEDMGISVRTVETQLYRAMVKLKEDLLHDGNLILFVFLCKSCK